MQYVGLWLSRILCTGRRNSLTLTLNDFPSALSFLPCYEAGRVDLSCLFELRKRLLELAVITKLLPFMDVRCRCQELQPLVFDSVTQLLRFTIVSLLVEFVGSLVVLTGLGLLAFVVEGVGVFRGGDG
jgi:hypothetical protein